MVKIIIVILLAASSLRSLAGYYFSNSGDDNNPGTLALPKSSIAEMQSIINSDGNGATIYLERGSVWYEASLDVNYTNVTIAAYGEGDNPILSGEKILTNPTQNGNIWTFTDSDIPGVSLTNGSQGRRFLGSVNIGGDQYTPARYPDGNAWLKTESASVNSATDNDEIWTTNQWDGGFVVIKNVNWEMSDAYIYSNTAHTLYTTDHVYNEGSGTYPPSGSRFYYILGAYEAMNLNGEWSHSPGALSVYWDEPTVPTVRVSVIDNIITLNDADYFTLENVVIRGANIFGVELRGSDYCNFTGNVFQAIGQYGLYVFGVWAAPPNAGGSFQTEIIGNEFVDNLYGSIYFFGVTGFTVTNNYIHRNALHNGYFNWTEDVYENTSNGYAITIRTNFGDTCLIKNNFIDSTQAGIMTHQCVVDYDIRENLIMNYGMGERGDLGAFYLVSDMWSSAEKRFRSNIIINAYSPQATVPVGFEYIDNFTHAVYFDQDSYAVKADSNSIEDCSAALMTNGGKYRSYTYNNILNPWHEENAHDAHRGAWMHSYAMDLYNLTDAESDTISNNTLVFDTTDAYAYRFTRKSATYPCDLGIHFSMDYNKYFYPYNNARELAGRTDVSDNYSTDGLWNFSQWQAYSTSCEGSTINPDEHSTVSYEEYVIPKLFKNFSDSSHTFTLGASYETVAGASTGASITVPAFYSTILFNTAGDHASDIDLYIDTTLVPMMNLSQTDPIIPPIALSDTLWAKDATGNKVQVDTACADSGLVYLSGYVFEEGVKDTIAKINFDYYNSIVPGWVGLNSAADVPDSLEIATDIWLINTPKLGGTASDIGAGTFYPFEVNYFVHYISASDNATKTYTIKGLDDECEYGVSVLSAVNSGVTRYLFLDIDGNSASVNAANNTAGNVAYIGGISPSSGEIEIEISGTYGVTKYINAMMIDETCGTSETDTSQAYGVFENVNFGLTGVDSLTAMIMHGLAEFDTSTVITLDSLNGDTVVVITSPGIGCELISLALDTLISGTHDIYFTVDSLTSYIWFVFTGDELYYANIYRHGVLQKVYRKGNEVYFIRRKRI